MKAFHNDPAIKAKYLSRVKAHAAADEIIHGKYWEDGKGCAVGCTIHSQRHAAYEDELGIPRAIARLEDSIFEGLPNGVFKKLPMQFLLAIPVGADLSAVTPLFLMALQKRNYARAKRLNNCTDEVLQSIQHVIQILADWSEGKLDMTAAERAESAAWNARCAAESAEYIWMKNKLLSILRAA